MSGTIRTASNTRRAIGIVRVSEVKGRSGDGFSSPSDQLDAIRAACARDGLKLLRAVEELDVSGGTPLEQRAGMRQAVEAVEAGEAQVIVAAYFDRLFRSLEVQSIILRRVEAAGGKVLALDTGEVTNGSAGEWLNATMRGMMAEYQRRTTAERSAAAQRRAIARGVAPWPNMPPGYDRGEDGRLVPNDDAPAVLEAFRIRARGATIAEVRAHLQANRIERSYHATPTRSGACRSSWSRAGGVPTASACSRAWRYCAVRHVAGGWSSASRPRTVARTRSTAARPYATTATGA